METNNIQAKLRSGDTRIIAETVGCSKSFVNMVLNGDRNEKTEKGCRVLLVARLLAEKNDKLADALQCLRDSWHGHTPEPIPAPAPSSEPDSPTQTPA